MRSPGVEVRPMTQITGHAEFCELFLDDVVVPKENLPSLKGLTQINKFTYADLKVKKVPKA